MQFSGEIQVKTVEFSDALEFTVTREDSLYGLVFGPVIALAVLYLFWRIAQGWSRIVLIVMAIFSVLAYLANRLHGRETKLRVTSEGLIAEGNLGRLFVTRFELAATDITKIRFHTVGEGDKPGLYVWHGWASACVLPGVDPQQADSIVDAIGRKLPELPTEHSESLAWRGEKLIELGLSKIDRKN